MARQFDGVDDYLESAATLDMTAHRKLAASYWLWADGPYNADSDTALGFGTGSPSVGGFWHTHDRSGPRWEVWHRSTAGANKSVSFTQPSVDAWHHFVINHDFDSATIDEEIPSVYIDGVSQSLSHVGGTDNTGTFGNLSLRSMRFATIYAAGRIAEIAIYGGIILAQADVDALYNGGNGALATDVQSGSLVRYWRVLGDASPEPAEVGGTALTVFGAVQVAHPFTLASGDPDRILGMQLPGWR